MDAHFLTEIEIEEFKCFKGFKTSGFKRVNLIGGKNNIGKTALMEAMYVNVASKNIDQMNTALYSVKFMRECLSFILKGSVDDLALLNSTKKYASKSNITAVDFSIVEGDATKVYRYQIGNREVSIRAKEFNLRLERYANIQFIDNFGVSDEELRIAYQYTQRDDKESELNHYIQEFDSSIDNFKIIGDKPQCRTYGEYRDITEFGDGLKSYVSMICALYACKNGYLFIDEMDNGIHYTQLDRLWEIILTLSKQTNCQVFASTHSKEVIESFVRVAKKLDEQEVSYTLLVKNKQQELATLVYDFEMLDYSMRMEHEVR